MTMELKKIDMFATFKTREELEAYIEKHTPQEKALLYMGMGLTWNYLAHKLEQEAKKNETHKR